MGGSGQAPRIKPIKLNVTSDKLQDAYNLFATRGSYNDIQTCPLCEILHGDWHVLMAHTCNTPSIFICLCPSPLSDHFVNSTELYLHINLYLNNQSFE